MCSSHWSRIMSHWPLTRVNLWVILHALFLFNPPPSPHLLEPTYPPLATSAANVFLNAGFWMDHKVFGASQKLRQSKLSKHTQVLQSHKKVSWDVSLFEAWPFSKALAPSHELGLSQWCLQTRVNMSHEKPVCPSLKNTHSPLLHFPLCSTVRRHTACGPSQLKLNTKCIVKECHC